MCFYRITNPYVAVTELCDIVHRDEPMTFCHFHDNITSSLVMSHCPCRFIKKNVSTIVIKYDYCVIKFSRKKKGAGSIPIDLIHPSHLENVFPLFIREHDFLSRTEKALHKKYALHLRNFNTRNDFQIGRCAVILFVGSYLFKNFTAFGNGYKIARGARMTRLARRCEVPRECSATSLFPMYIYIIFSCIIYIYFLYLYLYVFIDLHANKYYGIWQILCLT